jgi:signal transduction histidine kinase
VRWRPASTPKPSNRGDSLLVRRATLTIATLTAGAVAVVVAAVVLLSVALTIREQRADADRIVRDAATSAEDVTDPPPNVVLLIHPRGHAGNEVSAGAPPALATLDLQRLPIGLSQVSLSHDYRLFVSDRDGTRVVAALDLRYRSRETERLLSSLLPAGLVGIVAATIIGWLVARRAVRPLGDALALQRRFVADASHELRTPLTILHTRAQLLQRRASGDADLSENLERLTADTRALTEIVSDLLLSAEMQHRPADREPVNLARLARDVTASFDVLAEQDNVRLTTVVEDRDDVAGDGENLTVAGIPVALRRALSALIDNALGHVQPSGAVTVTIARQGTNVSLAVIDNGEGIDPHRAGELTQRFARGADAPGHGRRFGLGLALVHEVVDAHGGTLTLTGSPGQGTTATITIPAAPTR